MKKLSKIVLLLTLSSMLSGCMVLRSDKYLAVKPEEIKVSTKKRQKVFVEWGFSSSFFGQGNQKAINTIKSSQKMMLYDAINTSDCCIIAGQRSDADILINGAFHNDSGSAMLIFSVITGVSLYTIPSWGTSKMRITASVDKGKLSKDYSFDDSVFLMQWLPFVVVPIFTGNQFKIETEVNKNLYKSLLVQMKKDGFFTDDK